MWTNQYKKLNNGVEIPVFGLGVFRAEPGAETENAVRYALEAGYRHIDTAAAYDNEESVGKGIKASGVKREDIFITTKLWNGDIRAGLERQAVEDSLRYLQTDYIDLYLIHWPVEGYMKSWHIMEQLYKEGKIRAIGVSNFHKHHLETLFNESDIVPAVNQIEIHPLLSQNELIEYCTSKGIAVEAWSPMGGAKGNLFDNAVINKIAADKGKTAAQIMLRWHLQRDTIVIPKSVKRDRIISNGDIFDFELTAEEMAAINSLNINHRFGSDPDNFNF